MSSFFAKYGHIIMWLITIAVIYRTSDKVDEFFAYLLATALVVFYLVRWLRKRKG